MAVSHKFNKAADERVRKQMAGQLGPQFGADPTGGVVRAGPFGARVKEQIRLRKAKEKRVKVAKVRARY